MKMRNRDDCGVAAPSERGRRWGPGHGKELEMCYKSTNIVINLLMVSFELSSLTSVLVT